MQALYVCIRVYVFVFACEITDDTWHANNTMYTRREREAPVFQNALHLHGPNPWNQGVANLDLFGIQVVCFNLGVYLALLSIPLSACFPVQNGTREKALPYTFSGGDRQRPKQILRRDIMFAR